ncbi:hypothetical protein ACFYOD_33375 [Streptomyces sp. NPDC006703]|uniref:hypothetical protein n=1 Tax=Streptomyces sp. NPDC006703 TaxID=3364759 RepID=UPI0036B4AC38
MAPPELIAVHLANSGIGDGHAECPFSTEEDRTLVRLTVILPTHPEMSSNRMLDVTDLGNVKERIHADTLTRGTDTTAPIRLTRSIDATERTWLDS